MAEAKEKLGAILKALDGKKGQEIRALETGHITTLADYFVFCTATSSTQIKTLADECEKAVEELGESLHHREGYRDGGWVLLDFSDVVVHLFLPQERDFYDLERLWSDGTPVDTAPYLAGE